MGQQGIPLAFSANIANQANKHKPFKKGTKPSRNNTNITRRYSTTESDDQTDSSKKKIQSQLSEKLIKDKISGLDQNDSSIESSLSAYSNDMNIKSSSIETNTSSFTSYTNVSANQLTSHLAQTLENDLVVENIFDKCNIDD